MSDISAPTVWLSDPASVLAQRCAALATGLSPNPALSGEVCWCDRARGDWLASAIAPGFVRVFLLPGGGESSWELVGRVRLGLPTAVSVL